MNQEERVTYFAATNARGKNIPFGIKQKDRSKHMYVIGKTGMGKSTLLENLAIQDIYHGEGLAFIDPHGATAEKLLHYIPEHRIKDVIYFAPFDLERPIGLNVLEDVSYSNRAVVASGLMATFKRIWADVWNTRLEYLLQNTLLALLEYPNTTILSINRMYTDKEFRDQVVETIQDHVVKEFWTKEFAGSPERYTHEVMPTIQNKVGQFISNPLIRNIVGQADSSFDMRKIMDEKKILIVNLSKGMMGETNTQLLGSIITARIFLAAISRADQSPEELERLPSFFFYVDEFQNFANDTFSSILSEARKYKLNLVIAHQYIQQLEEHVRSSIFGNVGTTISFRVGPIDAEALAPIFAPEFNAQSLVSLGKYEINLSLMIDDVGSRPFSGVTIPGIAAPPKSFAKEVLESSRMHFGASQVEVENAIRAASGGEISQEITEEAAPSELGVLVGSLVQQQEEEKTQQEVLKKQNLRDTINKVAPHASELSKPFEVPEDTLTDIFKEHG